MRHFPAFPACWGYHSCVIRLIEWALERVAGKPTPEFSQRHWLESWQGRLLLDAFLTVLILLVVWLIAGFEVPP